MSLPRHILIVDDSPDDAELAVLALRRGGCDLTYRLVDTPEAMRSALEEDRWDLVISDYSMPRFNGLDALKLLRDLKLDLPFILISGTVGEDVAVEAMKCGAADYFLKGNLTRLPLAVEREVLEYEVRAERNRAEARYHSLVDRVPVGLFSISQDGTILEANPALIEMLGFSDAASLQRVNSASLWLRPEERSRIVAIIEREGLVQNFEVEMRRADGSVIWCEQSARAIHDAAGKVSHYEGVLVNIDSRKRAEEESNRARDRVRDLALETARLRSEFLANMTHEIRTPLAGIIGTGELLWLSELTHEQRRQAETIRSSGELLLTIVNDILDFSKLDAGRVELEQLDFDLVELTETLVDSFAVAARAKGVEIALHADTNLTDGLRGDPNRLRQVLNNLVSNAIKFTEGGEVLVRASRVEDTDNDVLVSFEVIDSGIGIPYEAQGRLFQPFVQAEGSTSRRFGGTGLGLVIAARLISQMGGEIGFESAPGKGSTFHFTARLRKGPRIVRPWMDPAAVSRFSGVRALIVNHSPASRQAIAGYLLSWGIENDSVSGEAESLDNLKAAHNRKGKRVVVLIDEQTPGIDVLRLARAIKDRGEIDDIKIIVLGAESIGKNMTGVVDAWITKPVRPSHLFSCLLTLHGGAERRGDGTITAPPPSPTSIELQPWRKAVRVLLVDDNLVNRTMGAKQLSMLGYTAEIVDGARRALEVVSSGHSDIVLMDCEMPEMDGYEAVAEIRRREGSARHTVIIALTAHATEGERGKCLTAGMDDYLSKPVKLQTLAAMLDTWSRGKLDGTASVQR